MLEELKQVQRHTADERNDQCLPHKFGCRDEPHVCRVIQQAPVSLLSTAAAQDGIRHIPKYVVSTNMDSTYRARLSSSATNMAQCHLWMVSATMSSSVKMRAVKEMETMWMNSPWLNSKRAPSIMAAPVLYTCIHVLSY